MAKDLARPDDQGSFLTGFTLGIFAGAVSYYLFATDKGKKLRTELNQEWQQARNQVGSDAFPYTSLRDVFKSVAKSLQIDLPGKKTAANAKKSGKAAVTGKGKFKNT